MLAMNDVVVVVPGMLGTTLHKDGHDLWAPSADGVLRALWSFGRSLNDLALPDGIGDDHPSDGVLPGRLMPDLHLVPGIWTYNLGYDRLLSQLRTTFHAIEPDPADPDRIPNLLTFPYDWRLSNRFNAGQLKNLVEPALERWQAQGGECAEARLVFVCHSMGGLIVRWYVSMLGGAEVTRRLITFGTPHRGSIAALDQLVNGITKGWGRFQVELTPTLRSLPSAYQLLPEYACIERPDGTLAKTTDVDLPELPSAMVADGMQFHDAMDQADHGAALLYPIVGCGQPTATTTRIRAGNAMPLGTFLGEDQGGDGTVPRLAAAPKALELGDPAISPVTEQHGTLQHNAHILDLLGRILDAPTRPRPLGHGYVHLDAATIGIETSDSVAAGEAVSVSLSGSGEPLLVTVTDEHGIRSRAPIPVRRTDEAGGRKVSIEGLAPGAHVVTVRSGEPGPSASGSVSTAVLVWNRELW